jgi:serine/threonine-protein kinase
VDGVHLDVYCDDLALGIEQRLQLFLKVCDAVSYAHRNLIVHLDLKPSNILATETDGTVKLLDFGTSKLILTDSRLTTTVMATPAYASPEQLRNEAVTTSCDIYSLGAILFELLAGRRPNLDRSIAIMIERSINETPPEWVMDAVTQSAAEQRGMTETRLRSLLRGDLATIVAKCLSPRPKDRYTTVDALITDLQRYLAGRPILARPQTTTYRISKFVRRNRKTVLLGAVAMLTLIASLGYAAWRQEQAYRAGQRALEMQTFMSQLFKLANTSYMGKPAATVPEFLQLGVKVMPDLIKSPADQRFALLSLGESMYADSDYKDAEPVFARVIESAKAAGDLGLEAEAEAYAGKIAYTQGDTERGKILAAHSLSLVNAPGVPPSSRVFIKTFYAQNQEEEGFRTDENVRLMKEAVEESRGHEVSENTLAYAELNLASMLGPRGNLQEEIHLTQDAVNIYSREPYAICDQANAANQLALIRNQTRDFKGSLVAMQESYAGYKRCSGQDSLKTLEVQGYLAAAMLRDGQAKAVIPMLEASMPKWIRLVGPDSDELATPLLFLSNAYIDQGEFGKGEEAASHLIRVEQPRINPLSAQMGVCQLALARALAGGHKDREALVHAELAEKAFIGENSKSPGTMANAAKAHKLLLELRARQ